jgi:hypothetical protein
MKLLWQAALLKKLKEFILQGACIFILFILFLDIYHMESILVTKIK